MEPKLTDPNDVKPMEATFPMRPAELLIIETRIRKAAEKKADIGWLNYLFNTVLWNRVIKKHARMDKRTLYWIMSNFDELSVFMPSPFWIEVTKIIDKLGEQLYKDVKAGGNK